MAKSNKNEFTVLLVEDLLSYGRAIDAFWNATAVSQRGHRSLALREFGSEGTERLSERELEVLRWSVRGADLWPKRGAAPRRPRLSCRQPQAVPNRRAP